MKDTRHRSNPLNLDTFHAKNIPPVYLFDTEFGPHIFIVNRSQIYAIDDEFSSELKSALAFSGTEQIQYLLEKYQLWTPLSAEEPPPTGFFPLKTLSLSIAQNCNLGCAYCYAGEGDFGGKIDIMPKEIALSAINLLLNGIKPGEKVNLAFLGGEPLINRAVLFYATEFAAEQAAERGIKINFSITSNGTMITPEDGEFFERHGFGVTISIDGIGEVHNRLRPFKSVSKMQGSYDEIIGRVRPLIDMQNKMQISARVTVTPENLNIYETLNELIRLGFHSVGFSPMLNAPNGKNQLESLELEIMLKRMIECGQAFERYITEGKRYPFFNMVSAMQEIHRGTHRPYPCGAGAGYLGVSAAGNLFLCHRFVNDKDGAMGNIEGGVDTEKQAAWISGWHVNVQRPCKSCWARYLCGGSCYYEVIHRGRPACNYILGWLHYCLQAYVRLLGKRPDYFGVQSVVKNHREGNVKSESNPTP
jgi:uncharacterized protein